jgi:photosystem II stability/assembly factor-like uncharacterized protein
VTLSKILCSGGLSILAAVLLASRAGVPGGGARISIDGVSVRIKSRAAAMKGSQPIRAKHNIAALRTLLAAVVGSSCSLLLLAALVNLTDPQPAHANGKDQLATVREAGPEDGELCCLGVEPLLFHGDQLLGITGRAGIFKSLGHGAPWTRSMKGLVAQNGVSPFVNSRCQAPSDPRIVYVLAGDGGAVAPFNGLFSTGDFGESWTRRGAADTGFGFNGCTVDAVDPRTVYVMGFDSSTFADTIWKSTDGGRTVQIFSTALPACARGTVFPRPGILYSIGSCGVVSTDGGVSFQPLVLPPGIITPDVSPDGSTIFVGTLGGVFRSIDRGASFSPVSGLPNGFDPFLVFDPTNPARIYASDGLLHVSNDGGASFASLPASNDPRFLGRLDNMSVDPRGSIYISTQAGPFRSDDRGKTFRSVLDGFRASSVQDLAFDADGKLLVGVLHTQTAFQQVHGLTFKPIGKTPDILFDGFTNNGVAVVGSPADPNVILVATEGQGLLRTDDGGSSWTPAAVSGGAMAFANSRMSFPTSSRVYLVSPSETPLGLYRSDDAGGTFAGLANLPFGALAVDPRNADVLYVGTYNSGDGLFKSTDGGRTLIDLGQPGAFSALAIDHRYPQIIYAGQRSGRVTRSLDGGKTFASASAGLSGAGVHGLAQDAHDTLFVWLRDGGLFASDNHAATWHAVDTGEALERSGVEFGRGSLVADPRHPGHLYLGNAGVIEIIADGDEDSHE